MNVSLHEPEESVHTDTVIPYVQHFLIGGQKYILDLSKVKTQQDVLNVLNHFSTKVELYVYDTAGIEQYVKPVSDTKTH
ncbi:hypothetical protein AAAC51_06485 [Priestia megaterium]